MKLTIEENRETIKRYGHIKPAPMWGSVRCSAKCPGAARNCTLEEGHRGPHVAHGMFKKVVAVWDAGINPQKPESRAIKARTPETKAIKEKGATAPKRFREKGLLATLKGLGRSALERAPTMEEALFIVLGLGMVWFAIETSLRILGWK